MRILPFFSCCTGLTVAVGVLPLSILCMWRRRRFARDRAGRPRHMSCRNVETRNPCSLFAISATMDDDVKLAMLTSMGFDLDVARSALQDCSGDVERAIEHCLGGGGGSSSTSAAVAASPGTLVRVSDSSQYTFGSEGRSACTCIALCYAKRFLQVVPQAQASATAADAIDESFLPEGLQQGVNLYKTKSGDGSTSVEHMSAEEVLAGTHGKAELVSLKMDGPVRQGVLSPDPSFPLGMHAVLSGCQSESRWVAVIITKSPETVAIALPPSSQQSSQNAGFYLLDSHPRPQFSACGSYVMAHDNIESLVQTLLEIFPFTDLGSDVGEMMQMMYNSFDAYALHM